MLLVQADTVSGVYEVPDSLKKEVTVLGFSEFMAELPRLKQGEEIGCAITNPADAARLDAEYGITRATI